MNDIEKKGTLSEKKVKKYPVPVSLNLIDLLKFMPIKGVGYDSDKQIDKALFILGKISVIRHKQRHRYPEVDSYIPLSSKILSQYVPEYRKYLEYFLEKKILETDNEVIKGSKCRGYRFTKPFRNVEMKWMEIKDAKFTEHIVNSENDYYNSWRKNKNPNVDLSKKTTKERIREFEERLEDHLKFFEIQLGIYYR